MARPQERIAIGSCDPTVARAESRGQAINGPDHRAECDDCRATGADRGDRIDPQVKLCGATAPTHHVPARTSSARPADRQRGTNDADADDSSGFNQEQAANVRA